MLPMKMTGQVRVYRGNLTRRMRVRYERALHRIGAFTRTVAKRSLRKRKSVSRPGQTPTSRAPHPVRNFMRYAVEKNYTSVVIGPTLLPRPRNRLAPLSVSFPGRVPTRLSVLEFSGTERVKETGTVVKLEERSFMRRALNIAKKSQKIRDAFKDINERI